MVTAYTNYAKVARRLLWTLEHSALPILRLLAATLILTLAAGCGGRDQPEPHRLDVWIDAPERELVMAAGAPDAIHELEGGNRILTWRRSRMERVSGEITTETETRIVNGQTVLVPVTRQEPSIEILYECTASFEIDAERYVIDFVLNGNACDDFLK